MPDQPTAPDARLVVFSDDWGRHPSSCQHIIRALSTRYRVDWVNTVGTRRPSLRLADLVRGAEKLRQWARRPRADDRHAASRPDDTPPTVTVHAPIHWPGFGSAIERALNRRLLLRSLHDVLRGDPPPHAVITTLPITADLARATADLNWVYYCVDDLASWPGLDAVPLRRMEAEQLPFMHRIIAVSDALCADLRRHGYDPALLTHGVDLDQWRTVAVRRRASDDTPVALFWGLADRRLDTNICRAVADRVRLRFVGPRDDVDTALLRHPNIEWIGPVPHERLPREAERADVLVMPYADMPATRAMQPLKLLEYLATDLPVVVTPLPANRSWSAAMDLAATPDDFVASVVARISGGLTEDQRSARALLDRESWRAKADQFERLCRSDEAP